MLYFDWHPAQESIALVQGIQPEELLLPDFKAILAAPFVPAGPVKDVKTDTGKICKEEEGEEEGMTRKHSRKYAGEKKKPLLLDGFYFTSK